MSNPFATVRQRVLTPIILRDLYQISLINRSLRYPPLHAKLSKKLDEFVLPPLLAPSTALTSTQAQAAAAAADADAKGTPSSAGHLQLSFDDLHILTRICLHLDCQTSPLATAGLERLVRHAQTDRLSPKQLSKLLSVAAEFHSHSAVHDVASRTLRTVAASLTSSDLVRVASSLASVVRGGDITRFSDTWRRIASELQLHYEKLVNMSLPELVTMIDACTKYDVGVPLLYQVLGRRACEVADDWSVEQLSNVVASFRRRGGVAASIAGTLGGRLVAKCAVAQPFNEPQPSPGGASEPRGDVGAGRGVEEVLQTLQAFSAAEGRANTATREGVYAATLTDPTILHALFERSRRSVMGMTLEELAKLARAMRAKRATTQWDSGAAILARAAQLTQATSAGVDGKDTLSAIATTTTEEEVAAAPAARGDEGPAAAGIVMDSVAETVFVLIANVLPSTSVAALSSAIRVASAVTEPRSGTYASLVTPPETTRLKFTKRGGDKHAAVYHDDDAEGAPPPLDLTEAAPTAEPLTAERLAVSAEMKHVTAPVNAVRLLAALIDRVLLPTGITPQHVFSGVSLSTLTLALGPVTNALLLHEQLKQQSGSDGDSFPVVDSKGDDHSPPEVPPPQIVRLLRSINESAHSASSKALSPAETRMAVQRVFLWNRSRSTHRLLEERRCHLGASSICGTDDDDGSGGADYEWNNSSIRLKTVWSDDLADPPAVNLSEFLNRGLQSMLHKAVTDLTCSPRDLVALIVGVAHCLGDRAQRRLSATSFSSRDSVPPAAAVVPSAALKTLIAKLMTFPAWRSALFPCDFLAIVSSLHRARLTHVPLCEGVLEYVATTSAVAVSGAAARTLPSATAMAALTGDPSIATVEDLTKLLGCLSSMGVSSAKYYDAIANQALEGILRAPISGGIVQRGGGPATSAHHAGYGLVYGATSGGGTTEPIEVLALSAVLAAYSRVGLVTPWLLDAVLPRLRQVLLLPRVVTDASDVAVAERPPDSAAIEGNVASSPRLVAAVHYFRTTTQGLHVALAALERFARGTSLPQDQTIMTIGAMAKSLVVGLLPLASNLLRACRTDGSTTGPVVPSNRAMDAALDAGGKRLAYALHLLSRLMATQHTTALATVLEEAKALRLPTCRWALSALGASSPPQPADPVVPSWEPAAANSVLLALKASLTMHRRAVTASVGGQRSAAAAVVVRRAASATVDEEVDICETVLRHLIRLVAAKPGDADAAGVSHDALEVVGLVLGSWWDAPPLTSDAAPGVSTLALRRAVAASHGYLVKTLLPPVLADGAADGPPPSDDDVMMLRRVVDHAVATVSVGAVQQALIRHSVAANHQGPGVIHSAPAMLAGATGTSSGLMREGGSLTFTGITTVVNMLCAAAYLLRATGRSTDELVGKVEVASRSPHLGYTVLCRFAPVWCDRPDLKRYLKDADVLRHFSVALGQISNAILPLQLSPAPMHAVKRSLSGAGAVAQTQNDGGAELVASGASISTTHSVAIISASGEGKEAAAIGTVGGRETAAATNKSSAGGAPRGTSTNEPIPGKHPMSRSVTPPARPAKGASASVGRVTTASPRRPIETNAAERQALPSTSARVAASSKRLTMSRSKGHNGSDASAATIDAPPRTSKRAR